MSVLPKFLKWTEEIGMLNFLKNQLIIYGFEC